MYSKPIEWSNTNMTTATMPKVATNAMNLLENAELKMVPVKQIHLSKLALRDAQTSNERFTKLMESIATVGLGKSPVGRMLAEDHSARQEGFIYELCDGAQRTKACEKLGIETIPFVIAELTDEQMPLLQIHLNEHTVKTSISHLASAYQRHMAAQQEKNPGYSVKDMARDYSESETRVKNILGLNNLDPRLKDLMDEDTIPVSIGYELGKLLDGDAQVELVRDKKIYNLPFKEAKELIDHAREEHRAAQKGIAPSFSPKAKNIGWIPTQEKAKAARSAGQDDYAEGLLAAWNMDKESQDRQHQDWEARAAEKEKKSLERKQEASTKRLADAAKKDDEIKKKLAEA